MVTFKPKTMYLKKHENITIDIQQIVCFTTFKMCGEPSPFESHDFWEFDYIESGEAIVNSDGHDIHLLPGEGFFNKPGTIHSTIPQKNMTIVPFCISFFTTSKIINAFEGLKVSLNNEQKTLIHKMYNEAKNLFVNSGKRPDVFHPNEYKDNYPLGSYQLLKSYMEIFLISIAREAIKDNEIISYDSKDNLEKLIYDKIIETISNSLYNKISVDDICNNFNYSRSYIYDIFKKYSGISMMKYYNSLKIKEAKKLIREDKYSLSKISDMLDFNNSFYFSRVFKSFEQITPSEYKKRLNK